jgi:hypothetical protein
MAFRLPLDARLVRFRSTDGLVLEGRLTPGAPDRAAVLCHPHPRFGGSMLTPVIMTAEAAFRDAGWTTLAFNFRGVGASEGCHGGGDAEVQDALGALAHLRGLAAGATPRVAIAGYSFGSVVGAWAVAADPAVAFYLGIAPPLAHVDLAVLATARCPIALLGGTRDEHGPRGRLEALAAALPRPPWLRVLETDHFFADALDGLAAACREAIAWGGTAG